MKTEKEINQAMREKYNLDDTWILINYEIEYSSDLPIVGFICKANYETYLGEKLTGIILERDITVKQNEDFEIIQVPDQTNR